MQAILNRRGAQLSVLACAALVCLIGCREEVPDAQAGAVVTGTAELDDGIRISYQARGRGTPVLVFVHGWSCDRSYWDGQVTYFGEKYRVVTVDLAGHGESGANRENWSMEAFGGDVAAVAEKLDLEDVVLVGHSMGGDVVVEAVQRMPERVIGVVLVDSFRSLESKPTAAQIEQFVAPFRVDFAGATDAFVRRLFGPDADPALVDRVAGDMAEAPPEVGLGCMEALNKWRGEKLAESLGKVPVPIIGINSDMRPTDVRSFSASFTSFKFVIMSGVGHFVMMENVKKFNEHLKGVVRELSPGESSSEPGGGG